MPDREKVIKGWETVLSRDPLDAPWDLIDETLAMLKQEAVEPRVSTAEQRCGYCNKVIEMNGWQSCPWCGKRIDWKGWWKKNGTRNQDS